MLARGIVHLFLNAPACRFDHPRKKKIVVTSATKVNCAVDVVTGAAHFFASLTPTHLPLSSSCRPDFVSDRDTSILQQRSVRA